MSALVYSSLNFKGKPHHLSQLGARELYPSMFSIGPGWGCHLHITSVSYPNAPALCIQMEAFILPLLGLHPSNAHLTGIPMFPAATVSDFVFGSLIWKVLRALVFLQTGRCRAPRGCLSRGKCYSAGVVGLQFDWLVARLEACGSPPLQDYPLKRSSSQRGPVVQHRGARTGDFAALQRIVLFNNCFSTFDEITKYSMYTYRLYECNSAGPASTGKMLRWSVFL